MEVALRVVVLMAWNLVGCAEGKTCFAEEHKQCSCDLVSEHEKLDIEYYKNHQFNLNITSGNLFITYRPCDSSLDCADSFTAKVCMYNRSSGEYFDLGEVSSLHEGNPWIVNSFSPLNFTITYYGGSEWNNMTLISKVTFAYDDENASQFRFLGSHIRDSNQTMSYEFEVVGPGVRLGNLSSNGSHLQPWIAGPVVVGAWVLLVVVTAVVVGAILCSAVKYDRRKRMRAGEEYQPLPDQPLPDQPLPDQPPLPTQTQVNPG